MPPRLVSLATRQPTTAASYSTINHVLRLVHNGYLDLSPVAMASGSRRLQSGVAGAVAPRSESSTVSSRQIAAKRGVSASRRYNKLYSSSAAQTIEHDHDHHHSHHSDPPITYQHHLRTSRPSSQLRSLPFPPLATSTSASPAAPSSTPPSSRPINLEVLSPDKRFIRPRFPPDEWAKLPDPMYKRLKGGAFQSAAHFQHDFDYHNLDAKQLCSYSNLARIFDIWKKTADETEWMWLDGKLARMLDGLDEQGMSQKHTPKFACSIRAYALITTGAEEDARAVLDQRKKMIHGKSTDSLNYAVAALAYTKLGEWENASKEMGQAIRSALTRVTNTDGQLVSYPSLDLRCLYEYKDLVLAADRNSDLVEIIRTGSFYFRHYLIVACKETHPFPGGISTVLYDALKRVDNPVRWWSEEYTRDPSAKNRGLGSLLFIALTRDRSRVDDALALYEALAARNVRVPNEAAIELCWLAVKDARPDAREIYQRIRTDYPSPSHQGLYRALQLAGRAGWAREEKEAWEQICRDYKPTWRDKTVLAANYAYTGRVKETIAALRSRLGEDYDQYPAALETLFTAYINANNVDGAKECLEQITAISPSLYTFNSLLQLYADRVDVTAAIQLFDRLFEVGLEPNLHSYTALISLFANRRDPVNADNVFRAMMDAGLEPDPIAHAAIINAEVTSGQWANAAKRWGALPEKIRTQKSVASAIIRALVLLPAPTEHVVALFRKIRKPSSGTWALVIQSASDSGDMDLARDLYEEMDQLSRVKQAPTPDIYTFSILLHGYMRQGDGVSSRAVYDEMLKREILPSSVTYGMIIQSFTDAKGERSLEQAHDFAMSVYAQVKEGHVADRRHQRSLINQNIFSPLVVAHGRLQNWDEAQSYFDMIDNEEDGGAKTSVHSYSQLMDVYRRAGEVSKVLDTWRKVVQLAMDTTSIRTPEQQEQHQPDTSTAESTAATKLMRTNDNLLCIPLSIVLDSLSSVGRYTDVKSVWQEVKEAGFGFDAGNYNHLAVALARSGDVEGAFMVADKILMRRFRDVKSRHHEALRETLHLESVKKSKDPSDGQDSNALLDVADIPVEMMFGPPNRRHEMHASRSPFKEDIDDPESASAINMKLLQKWRPGDTLWRPSLLTVSVLERAYEQLEDAKYRRAMVPLAIPDESEGAESDEKELQAEEKDVKYGVVLPLFGNVPVRNHKTGKVLEQSASLMLKNLNSRYTKIVLLLKYHRKKKAAAKMRADRRR
ncbi:hypothetical protein CI109_100636 [Kwoniella shandongensis]|uniref:Uncharacterized protein n=1 Tax=Kwoniella shandongensis TaxID=1734106 RepID=A0A5M6BZD1_9TREE|nr:uncharacterized protein CI109_003442 [Kwoniella shandongensis]KAA5528154.1 hypothetical protein CI109_003442 [Kwoniella shandongensis]